VVVVAVVTDLAVMDDEDVELVENDHEDFRD
jgi:hypothetical protein